MEHRPYPKIGARSERASGGAWVATEKIHGANLVVATDGDVVRIGKRKAWLADGDAFFGWQLLRRELEAAARAIHARLGGVVRVYGELFGGAYPHPDVAPIAGSSAVQTGIWYAPEIRFAVFDVLVGATEDDEEFLAHHDVEALAQLADLMVVPTLGRGPQAELERLPLDVPTRVPAALGLPAIDDNLAEGLVLKPDRRLRPSERPIVKRKRPELDEQRYDDSAPWDPDQLLALDDLAAIAARLVNPPRVASARSKVGDEPAAVRDEIVLDVLIDLEAAFPRAMSLMVGPDEERLRAGVAALAEAAAAA